MSVAIGPLHFVMDTVKDVDALVPKAASLRRASDDSKRAVIAASRAMAGLSGRVGVYVAQQHGAHNSCGEFLTASWSQGPRLVSPMLFTESVLNIAATHLSLTLRLTGVVETFMGARAAGIQAVAAAAEDVEAGAVDAGLVVVNATASRIIREAYGVVYRRDLGGMPQGAGAVAFMVRRGSGVSVARVCCHGRGHAERARSIRELARSIPSGAKLIASALTVERDAAFAQIAEAVGRSPTSHDAPEAFVLDPFLQLGHVAPDAPSRAVVCVGDDGIVGLLVVEGRVTVQ